MTKNNYARKILVIGMSPLPFENNKKVYGTGIRTWQFIQPLLENGHKLCVCNYAIPSAYPGEFKTVYQSGYSRKNTGKNNNEHNKDYMFEYNVFTGEDFGNIEILKDIYMRFEPDCIIGCSFYPSYIASKIINITNKHGNNYKAVPFWADLFGHVMAEAQVRAFMDNDDSCLFHYWNSEYNIITAADVFSCVSSRQEFALIGELGLAGRLNKFTSGYNFTNTVPCGMPLEEFEHKKNVIRGKNGVKENDFIVLWTGGYNTWTDVDTLFKGLLLTMEKNPKIKFVSTGGEIPEQDLKTYPAFLSMISGSNFKDNFIMRGWIAGEEVPNYYFESDAGINIDKDIYEVKLGSKSRILDWMRAGLCVLSSNVCELTEIIEREKIGYTFKPGNSEDLAEKILFLASHKDIVRQTGLEGKEFGMNQYNFAKTTQKLQDWVESPEFAPDKGMERKIFFDREEALKNMDAIVNRQKWMIMERDKRITELEGIIKKGFVYRIYNYLRIARRKIFK
ncbi:MAG: glycosyltransferase [Actinobacteria bacterium]|nr:glycosyltransferase [Actinomycetota bacterium]